MFQPKLPETFCHELTLKQFSPRNDVNCTHVPRNILHEIIVDIISMMFGRITIISNHAGQILELNEIISGEKCFWNTFSQSESVTILKIKHIDVFEYKQ